jgi:hypothetical protein
LVEQYSEQAKPSGRQSLRAHEAAEALFTPKQSAKPRQTETAAANTKSDHHKPRILPASPKEPVFEQSPRSELPRDARQAISDEEIPKIRTWIKYGMTVAQVAHVYGVSTIEVKRALDQH